MYFKFAKAEAGENIWNYSVRLHEAAKLLNQSDTMYGEFNEIPLPAKCTSTPEGIARDYSLQHQDRHDLRQKELQQRAKPIDREQPGLRDQFAMAALTGILTEPDRPRYDPAAIAAASYAIANAMLEYRNRVPK